MRFDVVIVGAGHGGAQTAISLRQKGFAGTIAIVTEEPEFPYERPPLSKEYLSGEKPFERVLIRPKAFWADREITLLQSERVISVEPEQRQITTLLGTSIKYEKLVWSAGATPRKLALPGFNSPWVHYVRNRADVDDIIEQLGNCEEIVVIGGGYVGLEAAAIFRKLGKSVTLLEAQDRVLNRVAGETISYFIQDEHRKQGVDIRLGAEVSHADMANGKLKQVCLEDGSGIDAQMIVVGIGVIPEVEPLRAAGALVSNGVHVDLACRTTLPNVYAIGDCALCENPFVDCGPIRLESVQNASDQAKVVAGQLTGSNESYEALPWFWSNQYDLRLQTAGIASDYDETVLRGDPDTRRFSVIYLKQKRVIAIDCVNSAKDYVQGQKLIKARVEIGAEKIATSNSLKELLAQGF